MTNELRYKTPEERAEAFRKFCNTTQCNECDCSKDGKKLVALCEFRWLALEAKEEKLLPCPLCGHPTPYLRQYLQNDGERWLVDCGACGAQIFRSTKESAIAAWNRRAK